MNNRKQTNERGKNPRQYRTQVATEPATITVKGEDDSDVVIPNPKTGQTKVIHHLNGKR